MGNSNKKPEEYQVVRSFKPEEWVNREKKQNFEIWENPTRNIRSDVYPIKTEIKPADLDNYQMRYNNSQDIVKVHGLRMDNQSSMCSKSADAHVYVERIPYRLGETSSLTTPEALSVLSSAYRGFNTLSTFYGPVEPYEDLICFNQQGKPKVWVNSHLAQNNTTNQKQQKPISSMASIHTAYVNKLFDMVQNKTQGGALPQKLKNKFRQNNPKSYFEALNLIEQYAAEENILIPLTINRRDANKNAQTSTLAVNQLNSSMSNVQTYYSGISQSANPNIILPSNSVINSNHQSRFSNQPPLRTAFQTNQSSYSFAPPPNQLTKNRSQNSISFNISPPTPTILKQNNVRSNVFINNLTPRLPPASPVSYSPHFNSVQVFTNTPQQRFPVPSSPNKINFQSPSKVTNLETIKQNNQSNKPQAVNQQVLSSPIKQNQISQQKLIENIEVVPKESSPLKQNQIVSRQVNVQINQIQPQRVQNPRVVYGPSLINPTPVQRGQPIFINEGINRQLSPNHIVYPNQGLLNLHMQNFAGPSRIPFNPAQQQQQLPNQNLRFPSPQQNNIVRQPGQNIVIQHPIQNQNIQLVQAPNVRQIQLQTNRTEQVQPQPQPPKQKQIINQNLESLPQQHSEIIHRTVQQSQVHPGPVQPINSHQENNQRQQQLRKQQVEQYDEQFNRNADDEQEIEQHVQGEVNQNLHIQSVRLEQNVEQNYSQQDHVENQDVQQQGREEKELENNYFPFAGKNLNLDPNPIQRVQTTQIKNSQIESLNEKYQQNQKHQESPRQVLSEVNQEQVQNHQQSKQATFSHAQIRQQQQQEATFAVKTSTDNLQSSPPKPEYQRQYQYQYYQYQHQNPNLNARTTQQDRIPDDAQYEDIQSYIRNKYRTYIGVQQSSVSNVRPSSEVSPYTGYIRSEYTRPETKAVDVTQMATYVESKYDQLAGHDVQFSFRPAEKPQKPENKRAQSYESMRVEHNYGNDYDHEHQQAHQQVPIQPQRKSIFAPENEQKASEKEDDILDVKNMERSLDKKYSSMKSNQQLKDLDTIKNQQQQQNQFDVKKMEQNLMKFQESRVGSGQYNTTSPHIQTRFETSQVSKIHSIDERLGGNRRSSMNRDFKQPDTIKYAYENQSPIYEFEKKSRTSKLSKQLTDIDEKFSKYVKLGAGIGSNSSKAILKPKQDNYSSRDRGEYDYGNSSSRMATGNFGTVEYTKNQQRRGYGYDNEGSSRNYRQSDYEKKTTFITSEVKSPKGPSYEDLRKFMWS